MATTREEIGLREANVDLLCQLILEWIRRNWDPTQLTIEKLSAKVVDHYFRFGVKPTLSCDPAVESGAVINRFSFRNVQTHLLYLNLDNSLHDCVDIESGDIIDSDIVQDYKKMSVRMSQPPIRVLY